MEISRALPEVVAPVLTGEPVTPPAWRVRIRMDDHPGTLARIAIRLADLECNLEIKAAAAQHVRLRACCRSLTISDP